MVENAKLEKQRLLYYWVRLCCFTFSHPRRDSVRERERVRVREGEPERRTLGHSSSPGHWFGGSWNLSHTLPAFSLLRGRLDPTAYEFWE